MKKFYIFLAIVILSSIGYYEFSFKHHHNCMIHSDYLIRQPYLQKLTNNGVTVKWQTAKEEIGCVTYAINNNNKKHLCETHPTHVHAISISGLTSGTTYPYKVRSKSLKIDNDGRLFTTLNNDPNMLQRIWVVGDSGHFCGNQQKVKKAMYDYLYQNKIDTWILLGDIAYAQGTQKEFNDNFFNAFPEIIKTNAIWTVAGNHDVKSDEFYKIFEMPVHGESGGIPSSDQQYYAFNQGNVHFIMLDSETADRSKNGNMAKWLKNDLSSNQKLWTIAIFHHPPYTKGTHNSDDPEESGGRMTQMRENIIPILEEFDVDIILSGHSHVYERSLLSHRHYGYSNTFNLSRNIVQKNFHHYVKSSHKFAFQGSIYIVNGAGAKGVISIHHILSHNPMMPVNYTSNGSLLLTVKKNHLLGEYVSENGKILDNFEITKR